MEGHGSSTSITRSITTVDVAILRSFWKIRSGNRACPTFATKWRLDFPMLSLSATALPVAP